MLERRAWHRSLRFLVLLGICAAVLFSSRKASAYPWMIRHHYAGCVPCHADPSGAGLLTEYGRAQGEILLRTRYGGPKAEEAGPAARFLWGVPSPDWLLLGGSFRNGVQIGSGMEPRFLQMEADLKAQVSAGRFRAYGSVGYMNKGAKPAQLTQGLSNNAVSREHWLGVDLGEDKQFLLRAGRIDIPFGVRADEHEFFVRSTQVTRTNINESQQHGVAFSFNGSYARGEVMALLGNYQMNPDLFRERGYAGFLEFSLAPSVALGVSSMLTYASMDYQNQTPNTLRQLHGAFARLAPVEALVIMAEGDAMIIKSDPAAGGIGGGTSPGFVSMLQADVEPVQGLHLIATGEAWVMGSYAGMSTAKSFSAWGSVLWFFAPHADVRFDFVATSIMNSAVSYYFLPQLHVYL